MQFAKLKARGAMEDIRVQLKDCHPPTRLRKNSTRRTSWRYCFSISSLRRTSRFPNPRSCAMAAKALARGLDFPCSHE